MASAAWPLLAVLVAAALTGSSSAAGDWDYKDHGPSHWATMFPQFCAGDKQSPIELSVASSKHSPEIKPYAPTMNVNQSTFMMRLKNDGHKIELNWSPHLVIKMGIRSDQQMYTAAQLHWHWGSDHSKGSEHTIEKRSYPVEGHLVFYNSQDYPSISEAVNRPNGLAVLGVFYEVSGTDNPLFALLDKALANESLVPAGGSVELTMQKEGFNIFTSFLPPEAERANFYRYEGSLTTPNCYESVLWTVYRKPVPISERQLGLLRHLKFTDNSTMTNNYRPPLPLNPANRAGTPRTLHRTFSSAAVPRLAVAGFMPVGLLMLLRLAGLQAAV